MTQTKRAIFDTNVYGFLINTNYDEFIVKVKSSLVIIYGCDIVRRELRATPKEKGIGESTRKKLLYVYDHIIDNHSFETDMIVAKLATEYGLHYRGNISKDKLVSDFLIVACASIHRLDVVVSEDNHTMFSTLSMKAYCEVNSKNQLPLPAFHSLKEFEKSLTMCDI